jgi:hypothetical protein
LLGVESIDFDRSALKLEDVIRANLVAGLLAFPRLRVIGEPRLDLGGALRVARAAFRDCLPLDDQRRFAPAQLGVKPAPFDLADLRIENQRRCDRMRRRRRRVVLGRLSGLRSALSSAKALNFFLPVRFGTESTNPPKSATPSASGSKESGCSAMRRLDLSFGQTQNGLAHVPFFA